MTNAGTFGRTIWWWAVGYAVVLAAVFLSVTSARQWALTKLGTAKSIAEWEAWRDDVRAQQDQPVAVQRRIPKSTEPPALVLVRDYFAVVLIASVVFCTLLYWVLAWLIAGALAG